MRRLKAQLMNMFSMKSGLPFASLILLDSATTLYDFIIYLFTTPHARGVLKRGCSPSSTLVTFKLSTLDSCSLLFPLSIASRLSLASRLSSLSPTHTTGLSLLSSLKLASLVSRLSRLSRLW